MNLLQIPAVSADFLPYIAYILKLEHIYSLISQEQEIIHHLLGEKEKQLQWL